MPHEGNFGRREQEGMASGGKRTSLEGDLRRLGLSFGSLEEEGMEHGGRGTRRREVFRSREGFFRGREIRGTRREMSGAAARSPIGPQRRTCRILEGPAALPQERISDDLALDPCSRRGCRRPGLTRLGVGVGLPRPARRPRPRLRSPRRLSITLGILNRSASISDVAGGTGVPEMGLQRWCQAPGYLDNHPGLPGGETSGSRAEAMALCARGPGLAPRRVLCRRLPACTDTGKEI
jgi:hypothetical protein